jgi:hypothetical protein
LAVTAGCGKVSFGLFCFGMAVKFGLVKLWSVVFGYGGLGRLSLGQAVKFRSVKFRSVKFRSVKFRSGG